MSVDYGAFGTLCYPLMITPLPYPIYIIVIDTNKNKSKQIITKNVKSVIRKNVNLSNCECDDRLEKNNIF